MRLLEKGLFILTFIGFAFLFAVLPGSSAIFGISFTALATLYFYAGFLLFNHIRLRNVFKKKSYANVSGLRIVGAVGLGIALSILLMGILFKLLSLPGANAMLTIGLSSLGIILLIVFILILRKGLNEYFKGILKRGLAFFILGLILYSVPSQKRIAFIYRNYPKYVEAYEEYSEDPTNEDLQKKLEEEYNKVFE